MQSEVFILKIIIQKKIEEQKETKNNTRIEITFSELDLILQTDLQISIG